AVAACLEPDRLVLARDAIGERSLYYAVVPGGVVFASTIHAILATGLVPRTVNVPALASYLSYAYVPGEQTMVRGVNKLLPGEIDSSLVAALARRLHDGPVSTYSVSFGPGYANELPFSSLVARHCATDHRVVELSPSVVLHHMDDAIGLLSDPIGDPLTVPNALLFREAAAEVAVVLNGEGGDPCFGGPKNLPMLLAELLGDGENGDGEDGHARARSYLRAHQKCYDDLPAMLEDDVRTALADAPLERQLAPHFDDPRFRRFVTRLMALNVVFK